MNKTKVKPSTGEGWAVHVYDSDRHLRFTLERSHVWAFSWGLGVGLLTAIVWSARPSASHSFSTNTDPITNLLPTSETSPEENLNAEPPISIPLGID